MGNTDSKQKLGEKVTAARKKLHENAEFFSQRSKILNSKSSKMSQYMIENIGKCFRHCAPFSEPTLLTAWYSNPSQCEEIVLNSCKKVLTAPITSQQWDWFNQYVFPSSIWMFKSSKNGNKFMYQELLYIADKYSKDIMESMDCIYLSLQHQKGWNQLMNIQNETLIARQDDKNVALLQEDAIFEIAETKSDSDPDQNYEMQSFLDSNWCLNSLLSTAIIINNEFQNHIKTVMSHYGDFNAGPLKKIGRCQSKLENDYNNAAFPKAAKLLDIVRCSVTFNTVHQLNRGYQALMGHIQHNQSMLQVARVKNAFLDKENGGYRDLKINVVYHSQAAAVSNASMICEVQLLIVNYLWEKKKIHKLYNVGRQEEYFKLVVADLSPAKETKLVPVFNFNEDVDKKESVFFKCSVDSELGLLAVHANRWFAALTLNTKEIVFEHVCVSTVGCHSHDWIKVDGSKYLSVQTDKKVIKMYKVTVDAVDNKYAFEEDKSMEIRPAHCKKINFIEFDRHSESENVFLILDGKALQQRALSEMNNVVTKVALQEKISNTRLKQLCLTDNGECCVVAGGVDKAYFYFIDLNAESRHKLASNVLESTYAPCFINGAADYAVIGDRTGKIEIWDMRKKEAFKVIDVFKGTIACTVSTNNILAVASFDKTIKLFDVRTWQILYSDTFKLQPYSLHLTSDAKYVTIGGGYGESCLVWKIESTDGVNKWRQLSQQLAIS